EKPLDAVFHLPDESAPGPEGHAIERDRAGKLQAALEELPERERQLLSLVYFGEHSIRAAGVKVGWRPSTAKRRHTEALVRLRALLGNERDLLSPAPLALLGTYLSGVWRATRELAANMGRRLAEIWRRVSPFADPGTPAAASGGGRVLGACGAAAATIVCG